jgi:hypothetical protein
MAWMVREQPVRAVLRIGSRLGDSSTIRIVRRPWSLCKLSSVRREAVEGL